MDQSAEGYVPAVGDRVWAFFEVSGDYVEAEVTAADAGTGLAQVQFIIWNRRAGDPVGVRFDQIAPRSGPHPIDPVIAAGPPDLADRAAEAEPLDPDEPPTRRMLMTKPRWKRRHGRLWHLEWTEVRGADQRPAVMILELTTPKSWAEADRLMRAVAAFPWPGPRAFTEVVY
jgi:hypothetical protein